MGIYLNPSNAEFKEALNGAIYVDKSGLLSCTNSALQTPLKYICTSRPRRFGKSMAANMLAAYYSKGCDSRKLFHGLKIGNDQSFETHLNQYNLLFLNMQRFLSNSKTWEEMVALIHEKVFEDLQAEYPQSTSINLLDLTDTIKKIALESGRNFVIIIDEWDCLFRDPHTGLDEKTKKLEEKSYLLFLQDLFKDNIAIALAYMTGILPIKKYGSHSILNMFREISMTQPQEYAEYMGFTAGEVRELCQRYHTDYNEVSSWYNGYLLKGGIAVYSPLSVVLSIPSHEFLSHWNKSEAYEALYLYIGLNIDGLKDTIEFLLAGNRKKINTALFQNDMVTFTGADDVLTLLIHLGYLGFDQATSEVFIPNKEVYEVFDSSAKALKWDPIVEVIQRSEELLTAIWEKDSAKVASAIEKEHEKVPFRFYRSEESLTNTVLNALFTALRLYSVNREYAAGRGISDIVLIPKRAFINIPAVIIEPKYNKSAKGAIDQIKNKQYFRGLEEYKDNTLLVGINFNRLTRKHTYIIEKLAP